MLITKFAVQLALVVMLVAAPRTLIGYISLQMVQGAPHSAREAHEIAAHCGEYNPQGGMAPTLLAPLPLS